MGLLARESGRVGCSGLITMEKSPGLGRQVVGHRGLHASSYLTSVVSPSSTEARQVGGNFSQELLSSFQSCPAPKTNLSLSDLV